MTNDTTYWGGLGSRRLNRRQLLATGGTVAVGLAGLSLIGCGDGDDSPAATPAPGQTTTPGQTPGDTDDGRGVFEVDGARRGGTYVNQIPNDPATGWDPHATISFLTNHVSEPIHAKLMRHDYRSTPPYFEGDEEAVIGEVAESVEQVDELTYLFQIRPDFDWPDVAPMNGRTITAQDVAYSFERAMSPGTVIQEYVYGPIDSVEAIDEKTVRLNLNRPQWRILTDLDSFNNVVLPDGLEADLGVDDLRSAESIRGAGPWILDDYQPGVVVRYRPNPAYRAVFGVPYFDQLDSVPMPDVAARLEAFRARRTSIFPVPFGQLDALRAARSDVLIREDRMAPTAVNAAFLNNAEPPFDDVRVRRALSVATDRDSWARSKGYPARWESGPITWGVPDWKVHPDEMPDDVRQWLVHDPQTANQLLAAAGYDSSNPIELNVRGDVQTWQTSGQLLLDMWNQTDFNVTLRTWEYNAWIAEAYQGNYRGMMHGPDNLDRLTQMIQDRLYPGSNRNHSRVDDPDIQGLLDEFGGASLERAKEITREIQLRSVEEAFAIYDPQAEAPVAWDPNLKNFEGQLPFNYQAGYHSAFLWYDA